MFVFEKEVKYGNAVVEKSFKFAVRIIKFYRIFNKKDYSISPLLKQLLRSGTPVQIFQKHKVHLLKKISSINWE
jgi:hypothetical protein